jgi:hypothetical protein
MKKCALVILFLLATSSSAWIQAGGRPAWQQNVHIGEVEFFGYAGLDLEKARSALPFKEGDELTLEDLARARSGVKEAIQRVTGHPATDVAMVCCDSNGHYMAYIGLQGKSMRTFSYNPEPRGSARLPAAILEVYKQAMDALSIAVRKGDAGEDDSKGYALSTDPATRSKELEMRKYAIRHEGLILEVLASASDRNQRQVASHLLGYAKQSRGQIAGLLRAAHDPDDGVRNNATRALDVLAGSSPSIAAKIPGEDFADMLSSGTWTDRNKAGALLMVLTKTRDPKLLALLRARVLDALVEMARWRFEGHAAFARLILGRIGGLDETRLQEMIGHNDQVEAIISSVKRAP